MNLSILMMLRKIEITSFKLTTLQRKMEINGCQLYKILHNLNTKMAYSIRNDETGDCISFIFKYKNAKTPNLSTLLR